MKRTALITGFTGQDGTFLTKQLLEKDYHVIGMVRRISTEPPHRIRGEFDFSYQLANGQLVLESGDLSDMKSLQDIFKKHAIDEVYNLGAQSDVRVSFDQPHLTFQANAIGVLNLISVMELLAPAAKLYQASTSELYGHIGGIQGEYTQFAPASPYAEAKLAAYWMVRNYRSRGHFACNGILFNHESEIRGGNFVTQKIVRALVKLSRFGNGSLELGNLEARRDWGYAGDFTRAMWLMLQARQPDDYVVATGETRSVRDFVQATAAALNFELRWQGEGADEIGYIDGREFIRINPQFYRPVEVDHLQGNATKARSILEWKPEVSFNQMVDRMVLAEVTK